MVNLNWDNENLDLYWLAMEKCKFAELFKVNATFDSVVIVQLYNYLLVIFIMNVRQSPLLWQPLHLVSSSDHQTVHHVHGVIGSSF